MNDRMFYSGTVLSQVLLALGGAVVALVGFEGIGIFLIGLAISLTPITGHLRMRRALATLRKSGGLSITQSDFSEEQLQDFAKKLDGLERDAETILLRLADSGSSPAEPHGLNELRREVRALRLKLSHTDQR